MRQASSQISFSKAGTLAGLWLSGIALVLSEPMALAQIVPDSTLPVNSIVVPGCTNCTIEGGTVRGTNLFHSFSQFSVPTGGEAFFNNAAQITNILTRVTGTSISNIDGLLRANGTANLFLLNPNGILFGPNAQLNIGGSFVATTANAIQFGDQGFYRATNPENSTLLSVNPSALWFNQVSPGAIVVQSVAPPSPILQVPNGRSLLLVGGELLIEGGLFNAPGGQVELLGIAAPGTVALNDAGVGLSLSVPADISRADIRIANGSVIDVTADNGGSITIDGRNIGFLSGSYLYAGIAPGLGTVDSQAGDITFRATGAVTIAGDQFQDVISNRLWSGAVGKGGNFILIAKSLLLKDTAAITVDTTGIGNAGRVLIQVDGSVTLTESSTIFNDVRSGGVGETGGITIQANSLALMDGAELNAAIRSQASGKTGDISIQVRDRVVMDGVDNDGFSSGVFNVVEHDAVGNAGTIQVNADSLAITRGARLQANSQGKGNSGTVNVQVQNLFLLDGAEAKGSVTGIFTDLDTDGEGNGGDIKVTTGLLWLKHGAQFTANAFAKGNAGDITIAVRDQAVFDGFNGDGIISGSGNVVPARSGVFSAVGESLGDGRTVPAIGNGGDIQISARTLSVTNGAAIGTAVLSGSQGDAGKVSITTTEQMTISDQSKMVGASGIFTQVDTGGVGNANDIEINTKLLTITKGAELRASTAGQGTAGNITINSRSLEISSGGQILTTTSSDSNAGNIVIRSLDSITLAGQGSGLFANTTPGSSGNGGDIFIDPRNMLVRDGARIAVDSQGAGKGGDIDLGAQFLTLDHANISAETASTQGGNITLRIGDILLLRHGSNISTTAGTAKAGGDGGNITINTPFLVAVPTEDSNIRANAFTGRGGNIQITAQGIFGIEFRSTETQFSDITASSQFGINGTVVLNTPDVDPTQGISNLSTEPSRPALLEGCQRGGSGTSRFIRTGRGGLPPSPDERLSSMDSLDDLPLPDRWSATVSQHPTVIMEAENLLINDRGEIQLVAQFPPCIQIDAIDRSAGE
ncbi:filamentous hemagglutinin N-terminal domain-containing protein [Pantanalinema sp. GBBB05]|uniref:two-partner secretion domain-containing protein n=1 Tax=Pantanalinema sp. GBBB05 TaxID=2604139 RepID=UPI001E14B61C|nr:filamentous hemagglutinin N-terminal domain-containing protein [Pantanalinema sp. GBBB05]